jgi:hypothetical protein
LFLQTVRAKRSEEELEDVRTKLPASQEARSYQTQIANVQKRAEEAEAALLQLKTDFDKQKQAWKGERSAAEEKFARPSSRPAGERRGWLDDLPNGSYRTEPLRMDNRPESPLLSPTHRTLSSDLFSIQSLSNKMRRGPGPSSSSDAGITGNGTLSRRPSALTSKSSMTPALIPEYSPTVEALPTPSFSHHLDRDRDDVFDNLETSSSPHQMLQDMVSVSTVAAGPSVQLVERMSAAIRRLESEKVATREELARISKQRDEARVEIVTLMREAEANKLMSQRVTELETTVSDVNARYETTLELLGEKSELVEELRADVEDVKAMYRDLVERTIR